MINPKERDIIIKSIADCDNKLLRVFTPFPNFYKMKISGDAKKTLRKALYINNVLSYHLYAFVNDKKLIQGEFNRFNEKLELVNNMIRIYNSNMCDCNFNIIEAAACDLKIVKFKSGKVQLQNRHITRSAEKLINKHKKQLSYYYNIAIELENYISEYNLKEFIANYIFEAIKDLKSNTLRCYNKDFVFAYSNKKLSAICRNALFADLEDIEKWETCNF